MFIFQRRPMRGKALTASLHSRLLGDQIDVGGYGSTCSYRGLDSALEVSRQVWGVLHQYLEHIIPDEIEILSWIQAKHVDDARRVEGDGQSVEG